LNPSQKKVKFSLGLNQQEGTIEKGQNDLFAVSLVLSERYRITEWFGLEETLQTIQFHPPAMSRDPFHEQGPLPPA